MFVAPTGMTLRLVKRCARAATAALAALVAGGVRYGPEARAELERTAAAAAVWTRTLLDCHAVEDFLFDPAADPDLPW